jgi:hypothetical protein
LLIEACVAREKNRDYDGKSRRTRYGDFASIESFPTKNVTGSFLAFSEALPKAK